MIEDARLLNFYVHQLTKRQQQIVQWTAQGLTNTAIGERLYIASCVVASHLTNIYAELATLDELSQVRPNRYLLIRLFALFFERHPELKQ